MDIYRSPTVLSVVAIVARVGLSAFFSSSETPTVTLLDDWSTSGPTAATRTERCCANSGTTPTDCW